MYKRVLIVIIIIIIVTQNLETNCRMSFKIPKQYKSQALTYPNVIIAKFTFSK